MQVQLPWARSKEVRSVPLPWKRGQRVLGHDQGRMGRIRPGSVWTLVTDPTRCFGFSWAPFLVPPWPCFSHLCRVRNFARGLPKGKSGTGPWRRCVRFAKRWNEPARDWKTPVKKQKNLARNWRRLLKKNELATALLRRRGSDAKAISLQ
jgi:hypothetical protein